MHESVMEDQSRYEMMGKILLIQANLLANLIIQQHLSAEEGDEEGIKQLQQGIETVKQNVNDLERLMEEWRQKNEH